MKKANYFAVFALLFVGLALGFLVGERKYKIPADMEIVPIAFLDSIRNLKPDTIWRDSIVWKDTTVYKYRPIPVAVPTEDPDIVFYSDSIVNDSTFLVINDKIKGQLMERSVLLSRAVTYRYISTPYPVIFDRPVITPSSPSLIGYGDILFGGNQSTFQLGGEVGMIDTSNTKLGFQIATNFDDTFYFVKLGKAIRF